MADETTELEVSITDSKDTIAARGKSEQVLANLAVKNGTAETIAVGGTEWEVEQLLNVGIGSSTIDDFDEELSFLYIESGGTHQQFDVTETPVNVDPGETIAIQVRLKNAPGALGTFKLLIGDGIKDINCVLQ